MFASVTNITALPLSLKKLFFFFNRGYRGRGGEVISLFLSFWGGFLLGFRVIRKIRSIFVVVVFCEGKMDGDLRVLDARANERFSRRSYLGIR